MKKNVIITGAGGNLGKAVVLRLLNDGYHVHGTIGPKDDPKFIEHENLVSSAVNLLDEDLSRNFVNDIISNHGDITGVICIVGGFTSGGLVDTSSGDIQKMVQLNFLTTYHVIQPLIKVCLEQKKGTQFILIGSRPALNPAEGKSLVAYSLSKTLLFKYAEFINEDSNETGISATVIVPSTMDTATNRKAMPKQNPSNWVPLENVADTVSFIFSETGKMMKNPIYKLYNKS